MLVLQFGARRVVVFWQLLQSHPRPAGQAAVKEAGYSLPANCTGAFPKPLLESLSKMQRKLEAVSTCADDTRFIFHMVITYPFDAAIAWLHVHNLVTLSLAFRT